MQVITGILLLGATVGLYAHYRPRWAESLGVCIVCFLLGLLSPILPGQTSFLIALGLVVKGFVLLGCWVQLKQESRCRAAQKKPDSMSKPKRQLPPVA